MNPAQARHIIKVYGKILSNVNENQLFLPKNQLPFSTCMIRYAIYTYIDDLVMMRKMTPSAAESLIVAYGHLSFFVDDDKVDVLNNLAKNKYKRNDSGTRQLLEENSTMIKMLSMSKDNMVLEIQQYITECLKMTRN